MPPSSPDHILDLDRAAHDRGGPGEGEVEQAAVRERANAGRVTSVDDVAATLARGWPVRSRPHDAAHLLFVQARSHSQRRAPEWGEPP